MSFFCDDPICGELSAKAKNIKVTNLEFHGDIWCHMFGTQADAEAGAKEFIDALLAKHSKKKTCTNVKCTCISREFIHEEFHVHTHVRKKKYSSGFLHGNCVVEFDLDFDVEVRGSIGICVDLEKIGPFIQKIKDMLDKLVKLGDRLKELIDPENIAKKVKRVTPKQLRDNPNVEKPIKIKRKSQR